MLPLWLGAADAVRSVETARVHQAARRCNDVASGCIGAVACYVIGFLGSASPGPYAPYVAAFRQGLKEAGLVEGQIVAIEFRWAENQNDRLPALATELVRRQVSVIAKPIETSESCHNRP